MAVQQTACESQDALVTLLQTQLINNTELHKHNTENFLSTVKKWYMESKTTALLICRICRWIS